MFKDADRSRVRLHHVRASIYYKFLINFSINRTFQVRACSRTQTEVASGSIMYELILTSYI